LNRVTAEQWSGTGVTARTINYAYNAVSDLTSASDPDSAYAYTYDNLDRVTSSTNAGTPGVPTVVLASAYDADSRRTSLTATVGGTADFQNTYLYDPLSRMTSVRQTGQTGGNTVAQKRVDFEYNAIDQFTKITRYKDTAGAATTR